MRIVSGKFRGKLLQSTKDDSIRPTTDMVKESVFNIIQFDVPQCKFLDLFAGSGAIGIEAISRGASEVVFVDNSKDSIEIIRCNLRAIDTDCKVINLNYVDAASQLKGQCFDIIYLDPPYDKIPLNLILKEIADNDLLAENGMVVYESLTKTNQKSILKEFKLVKNKKYGSVTVDVYKRGY